MCENTIQRKRRKTQALAASAVVNSDNKNMLNVKLLPTPEDERVQQNERKPRSGDKRRIDSDAITHKKKAPRNFQSPLASEDSVSQNSSSKEDDGVTFKESIEKARALSRLYSQRNRDKQKTTVDELNQEKCRLAQEQSELQGINRQILEALQTATAENRMLRQQHLLQSQISIHQPSTAMALQLAIPLEWQAWFQPNFFPHK